jgi:hypothetical protein
MKTLRHQILETSTQSFSIARFILKIFFVILVGTLVMAQGPAALRTIADANSLVLQIFLETCRISLFVLNILGR